MRKRSKMVAERVIQAFFFHCIYLSRIQMPTVIFLNIYNLYKFFFFFLRLKWSTVNQPS